MPRILVVVAVEAERAALPACVASPHVVVEVAGIGRTNAAAACAARLAGAAASGAPFAEVLSVGIAGSLPGSGLGPGDVVVAEACTYAEEGIALPEGHADVLALGFPLGDFEGNRVPVDRRLLASLGHLGTVGTVATVATCSGTDGAAASVRARTGALAEAMEGAAVVHAARRAGIPAIEVRAVSNTTGDRAAQRWDVPLALRALDAIDRAIAARAAGAAR